MRKKKPFNSWEQKNMEKIKNLTTFQIILIGSLLKCILILFFAPTEDIKFQFWEGMFLINGDSPYNQVKAIYLENGAGIHTYPPLYYIMNSIFDLLTFQNFIFFNYIIRLLFILVEAIAAFGVYLVSLEYFSEEKAKKVLNIYIFNPIGMFFIPFFGFNETFAQLPVIFGIYYLIKNRNGIAAFFIGLGVAYFLFPIFYLIFIIPNFIRTKKSWYGIIFVIEIFLIYLCCSIPFLIMDGWIFVKAQFQIISRVQAATFILPWLLPIMNTNLFEIPWIG
jgi:Gpi18-like mannosyltransferase